MSDDARGDDVYQPTNDDTGNPPDDAFDPENVLDERSLDDTMEEGYSPPERPLAVEDFGTTQEEQESGESLDDQLAREVPDVAVPAGDDTGDLPGGTGEPVDDQAGAARTGRLVASEPGPGSAAADLEAEDVGIDGGAASAEEAAVHTIPETDESPEAEPDAADPESPDDPRAP
jgi:hypothetical protein